MSIMLLVSMESSSQTTSTSSLSKERCIELAALRDGPIFTEFSASQQGIVVARQARRDLNSLVEFTRRDARKYAAATMTRDFLLLSQLAANSLQTLIAVPWAAYEGATSMTVAYAATEIAKRAVGSAQVMQEINNKTPQYEMWLSFGTLMPLIGDPLGVIKTARDYVESRGEINIDLRSFGTQIQGLEKQIAQATSRLERLQFRYEFAKAFKREVDLRCGHMTKGTVPAQASAAAGTTSLPSKSFREILDKAKTESGRMSVPKDCGILDNGQASLELSFEQKSEFEALLALFRERRR